MFICFSFPVLVCVFSVSKHLQSSSFCATDGRCQGSNDILSVCLSVLAGLLQILDRFS